MLYSLEFRKTVTCYQTDNIIYGRAQDNLILIFFINETHEHIDRRSTLLRRTLSGSYRVRHPWQTLSLDVRHVPITERTSQTPDERVIYAGRRDVRTTGTGRQAEAAHHGGEGETDLSGRRHLVSNAAALPEPRACTQHWAFLYSKMGPPLLLSISQTSKFCTTWEIL